MAEDEQNTHDLERSRVLLAHELKRLLEPAKPKPRPPTAGTRALNISIERWLTEIEALAPRSGRGVTRRTAYPYLAKIFALVRRCAARRQIEFLVNRVCSTRSIKRRNNDGVFGILIAATSKAPKSTRGKWAVALTIAFFDQATSDDSFEGGVASVGGLNKYIKSNTKIPRRRLRSDSDTNQGDDNWDEDDWDRNDPDSSEWYADDEDAE